MEAKDGQSKFVCGLRRKGENVTKYKFISLEGKDEVIFGRAPDINVCLVSPMISRCHAIAKKIDNKWCITDNKSLNGVFINDIRIDQVKPRQLREGDIIRLGVPSAPGQPPEFVWQFREKFRVMGHASGDRGASKLKRGRVSPVKDGAVASTSGASPSKPGGKRMCVEFSPGREYREKLIAAERSAAEKIRKQQEQLEAMELRLREKGREQEQMAEQLQQQQEEMKKSMEEQLQKQQDDLTAQRADFEAKLRAEYEEQLMSRETELAERLMKEKETLVTERQKVEEQLQLEMERKLEEKDQHLQAELERQKENLDKVIQNKECEQRLLQTELENTKSENQQHAADVLRAKEEILSGLADLMETELQCSICNELFVQATSLNCSHSFCAMCIAQWMQVKKECPVCRAPIKTHLRSIVLDSYIDRMVEQLSEDLKQSRKNLVEERKKAEEDMQRATQVAPSPRGRGRRGRGRGRGRRGGAAANPPEIIIADEIIISGEEEVGYGDETGIELSSDDDDDSIIVSDVDAFSDSSVEGDDDVYYGGGVCFNCGRRGHWVRACPYR